MKPDPQRGASYPGEKCGRSTPQSSSGHAPGSRTSPAGLFAHLCRSEVLAAFLGAFVLAAFFPVIRHDFINLDDPTYVTANYHVQSGLTLPGIRWAFTTFYGANWHPLTWVSHMIDCQLFGLRPTGHHLTSILLHAINSVLLFIVLKALTAAKWRSLAVALLFGLHPLRIESVAWVSERKDVLSTCFFLLTLWAYFAYVQAHKSPKSKVQSPKLGADIRGRGLGFYWLSLGLFALGLMSKPMLVTLPFLLLLLDYWPLGVAAGVSPAVEGGILPPGVPLGRMPSSTAGGTPAAAIETDSLFCHLVWEKIPFFCLSLAACVITYLAQKGGGTLEPVSSLGLAARCQNAMVAYVSYLEKLFYPVHLAVFYPRPAHASLILVFMAVLAVIVLSAFAIDQRRQRPYLFVGWFWFLGTLIPVIGLVQVGTQAMADRYSYIPCIGILILLVWALADFSRHTTMPRAVLPAFSVAAILCSAILTREQLGFWRNSETLFRHALQVTSNNYVAHDSLGDVLADKGLVEPAEQHYREALRLSPSYGAAHNNLGLLLMHQGKLDEAIAHYEAVLKTSPNNPDVLANLGNALYKKGDRPGALDCFQRALVADPDHPEAHENLARVLFMEGRSQEGIAHFREVLRIRPDYAMAHHNLAVALLGQGHSDEAIQHLRTAIRLEPQLVAAHDLLGAALAAKGALVEAEAEFREALRTKPQDGYALANLGTTLARQGRLDEAVSVLQQAVRSYPGDADAHLVLGKVLANQGNSQKAMEEFKTAIRLRPADPTARQALETLLAANSKTNAP